MVGLHRHLYAAGDAGALHSTRYIYCCAPDVVVRLTDRNHSRHYRAVVDPCQKVAKVMYRNSPRVKNRFMHYERQHVSPSFYVRACLTELEAVKRNILSRNYNHTVFSK